MAYFVEVLLLFIQYNRFIYLQNTEELFLKTNRTVQRAIQMLSYTAAHPEGVSLDEYCEQLALPKTSAYDILVTLVQEGMLSIKPGPKQLYQIGIFAYRIGMSYPDANDTLKLISSELTELARTSDRTAFFGKLSNGEVVYLLKEVPDNPIITTATVGSTAPLYCTSLGKTLLAFLPKEQSAVLLEQLTIQPRTRYTLKAKRRLWKIWSASAPAVMHWTSASTRNIWSAPVHRSTRETEHWRAPSASPAFTAPKTIMMTSDNSSPGRQPRSPGCLAAALRNRLYFTGIFQKLLTNPV